jgi:hypothetical protein
VAGVDNGTAYRWRSINPDFAHRWEEAQLKGIHALVVLSIRRVVHGPRIVRRRKGPSAALPWAQRELLAKMAAKWWTPHCPS